MTADRWRQIEEIYQTAADLDVRGQRAFLDSACGSDFELRKAVNDLLAVDGNFDVALEAAIRDEAEDLASEASELIVGRRIGPYRITAVIGAGGMGAIYRAARDDDQYEKDVAIKVVKRGMDLDAVVRRFRSERQILARLEHSNIARLFDGGVTEDGQPYFVMEYVDGQPLTGYCATLPLKDKLQLFRQVCAAVEYAHQNLIVHRDLKPANILVTKNGVVKLLDFGLAKVLSTDELSEQTYMFLRMLTPDYASPEQVRGEVISSRSDIYSLGAILYELVSGGRAHQFKNRTTAEIERVICEEDPPRIPGELGSIAQMAMHKDPDRRYASAQQLSEDIHRYLEGLPLLARNSTIGYRLGKFARRNKASIIWSLCFSVLSSTVLVSVLSRESLSVRTTDLPLIPVQLTTYAGDERRAALSPQGTHVVFEWDGGEEKNFDIYLKRLPTGEPLRLTRDPNPDLSPAWSPDGKRIAFLRALQNGRAELVIVAASGGPEQKVLSFLAPVRYLLEDGGWGGGLTWAPDGRTFVLCSARQSAVRIVLSTLTRNGMPSNPLQTRPRGCWAIGRPQYHPTEKGSSFNA